MAARSKQVWGYDNVFMREWLSEWAEWFTEFAGFHVVVLEHQGLPAGFYALDDVGGGTVELWALFVDPTLLRRGLGRLLMEDAIARAKRHNFAALLIHADPNAAAFYRGWPVTLLEEAPCTRVPGEQLPTFRLALADTS